MPDTPTPAQPSPVVPEAICPYCGVAIGAATRCPGCKGLLDPLSRQASTNSMGPWFVRDEDQPFRPGCSHDTLRILVARGKVTRTTIVRGPTTRQFWTHAGRTRGLAHLLGVCHNCQATVSPSASECGSCGASFAVPADRQQLGLGAMHAIPVPGSGLAAATSQPSAAPLPAGVTVVGPAVVSAPRVEEWAPAPVAHVDMDWAQAVQAAPMDLTAGRASSGSWGKLAALGAVLLIVAAGLLALLKDVVFPRDAEAMPAINEPIVPAGEAGPAPGIGDTGQNPTGPNPKEQSAATAPPASAQQAEPAGGGGSDGGSGVGADPDFARASALATSDRIDELDQALVLIQALTVRHPAEAARLEALASGVRTRREALSVRGMP